MAPGPCRHCLAAALTPRLGVLLDEVAQLAQPVLGAALGGHEPLCGQRPAVGGRPGQSRCSDDRIRICTSPDGRTVVIQVPSMSLMSPRPGRLSPGSPPMDSASIRDRDQSVPGSPSEETAMPTNSARGGIGSARSAIDVRGS